MSEEEESSSDYTELLEKVREVAIKGLDELSVSDIISVLDRVKTELMREEIAMEIKEELKEQLSIELDEIGDAEIEDEIPERMADFVQPKKEIHNDILENLKDANN